jgi:hypothetical protein
MKFATESAPRGLTVVVGGGAGAAEEAGAELATMIDRETMAGAAVEEA